VPRPRTPIDFAAIAAAAVARAELLVAQWLPGGKRVGNEWKCGSLAGDAGDSCSVNLSAGKKRGAWADFATDECGGDLISLYAAVHGVNMGAAARAVAQACGLTVADDQRVSGRRRAPGADRGQAGGAALPAAGVKSELATRQADPASPDPSAEDAWTDAGPWPVDGPRAPTAHVVRGKPAQSWVYRNAAGDVLGYVHRFVTSSGGKEVLPCVWSKHPTKGLAWRWRAFSEPRPLYGLPELAAAPDNALVLVVEGEKCADAAREALGRWPMITWPGGCKAYRKADWSPLAGRKVILWPDADAKADKAGVQLPAHKQPGMAAMVGIGRLLEELGCAVRVVRIPEPGTVKDGWDVADLVAQAGADAPAAVRERVQQLMTLDEAAGETAPEKIGSGAAPADGQASAPAHAPAAGGGGAGDGGGGVPVDPADDDRWRDLLRIKRGELVPHVSNIATILRHDARWRGVVAFDEFAQATVKRTFPPYAFGRVGEWEAEDDSRTAAWLAQQHGLYVSSAQVTEAVELVAREARFHPVVDHLRQMRWDGTRRLKTWLRDYLGVADTLFTRAVARYFMRGMVRRVMEPGCKFDYCLVLEGAEGLRKSTLAMTLGGAWGSDVPLDLANNREAANAIHGRWVIEFSEMESVTRAEAHLQKSFLSRQFDQYRPVYSRRNVKVPRQCVFIGTTNESEYIKEGQGARRFWPLEISRRIDVEGLRRALPQLLAEAVHDYDAGLRCYPREREQREVFRPEQMRRVQQESLIDALHDWVLHEDLEEAQNRLENGGMFSLADACFRCLKISYAQLTRDLQTRVGKALASLGCERVEKRNGMTRYWYKPPQKAATSGAVRPAQHKVQADDDMPF